MYSRVHIPPYHRCTKFENFLPIICRDIPHFVNFILVLVRLWRYTLSNLHMWKTWISREWDKILRNRERLSYSFRNYNLPRSKLHRQFFRLRTPLKPGSHEDESRWELAGESVSSTLIARSNEQWELHESWRESFFFFRFPCFCSLLPASFSSCFDACQTADSPSHYSNCHLSMIRNNIFFFSSSYG